MKLKKYTLYYKGKNEYGHEHNLPIISLNLKDMDYFTCMYDNYLDLFMHLPLTLKDFIKKNLFLDTDFSNNESLSKHFFITDNDFTPIMELAFSYDNDVLFIEPDELIDNITHNLMTIPEFQNSMLKANISKKIKKKYEFFSYLYYEYVKDKKISCMIDVYETNLAFPNLDCDNLMIASIATDRDNIIVLGKKLGQNFESRRNLAFKYKGLFNELNGSKKLCDKTLRSNLDYKVLNNEMLDSLDVFVKKYNKEYNDL